MIVFLLVIIYALYLSIGLPNSLLGSAWPSMYGEIAVPVSYMGAISMILMGCSIVTSILSGALSRRFETGKIVAAGVLMIATGLLGFSASRNFPLICACAVPLGLGTGLVQAFVNNYAAVNYKAKHMNWMHCFWGIGATAGPVIVSYCLNRFGSWRFGYQLIGAGQMGFAVAMIFAIPLWRKAGKAPETEAKTGGSPLNPGELLHIKGIKYAIISFFCYCAMEMTVGFWGSSYLAMAKGLPAESAAKWISLFYFGLTFGRLFSGFLTIRLSNLQMIRLGCGLFAAGVALMLAPIGIISYTAGFCLMGVGCAPVFPSLLHATPVIFGKERSQAIVGVQLAGAFIGAAVMPPIFGAIAGYVGYWCFPLFLAALLIATLSMIEALYSGAMTS